MATQEIKEYSFALKAFINEPEATAVTTEVTEEVNGFLQNRPVVHLTNGNASVCYLRPGVDSAIQRAFITKNVAIDLPAKPLLDKAHTFSDLTNPALCSKHPEDLKLLYEVCKKVGLVRQFYMEVISHDTDYFQQLPMLVPPSIAFSPVLLSECPCDNHKNNRLFSDTRYSVETRFVQHILKTVPNKQDRVRVISMGSGKLLQDFKLIGLLVKEGYKQIHWSLVDPINSDNSAVDGIKSFFSHIGDVEIDIIPYLQISDVPKDRAHAVLSIDIASGCWNDLINSHSHLGPKGKLLYAGGPTLFEVGAKGFKPRVCASYFPGMIDDIDEAAAQHRGAVRIACTSNWMWAVYAVYMLTGQGLNVIHLTIDSRSSSEPIFRLFPFLFPGIKFHYTCAKALDVIELLEKGHHYDFVLGLKKDEEERISNGFKAAPKHIMGKTTTIYALNGDALSISRVARSE